MTNRGEPRPALVWSAYGCSSLRQSFSKQLPAFEVAPVKPNAQGEAAGFAFDFTADGGITSRNFSTWNLIRSTYNLRDLEITGGSHGSNRKASTSR